MPCTNANNIHLYNCILCRYEFARELPCRYFTYTAAIPALTPGETELVTFRAPTTPDIDDMMLFDHCYRSTFHQDQYHYVVDCQPKALPVLEDIYLHRRDNPFVLYVRVADIPGFLRHISSVLERRLARSPLTGHTGELKISFFRDAVRLAFEEGRIVAVEAYKPPIISHTGQDQPDLG